MHTSAGALIEAPSVELLATHVLIYAPNIQQHEVYDGSGASPVSALLQWAVGVVRDYPGQPVPER